MNDSLYKSAQPPRFPGWRFALTILLAVGITPAVRSATEVETFTLLMETLEAADDPAVRTALLRGMLRGLEGRRNVTPPQEWNRLREKLANSDDPRVRELSFQLAQVFGDQAAVSRAMSLVKDEQAEIGRRLAALHLLLNQQNTEASSLLATLLDEPEFVLDAIRGYAMVENEDAPQELLGRYGQLNPEHQRAVIETLSTRKAYAEALLKALQNKQVNRDDVPTHVARSLRQILGDRFVEVFGEVRPVAEDREKLLEKYKKLLNPDALASAQASRGRVVFNKTCASCHKLYGEGGSVGPDLTGSNRANLDYILLNSVDPSYDVPDAYRTVTVVTVDGRVINGVLAEEDASRVVLKTAEQPRVVVAKEDIEVRRISPKSMMPEGQLEQMKSQEVIDLVKYLRTTEQVEVAQ